MANDLRDTRTRPVLLRRELGGAGLFTVLLGAALAPIDLFIVNVALPTINAELRTSSAALEWIVAAYGVAFALLLVVGGRLGDAFGRRRLFMTGLSAFTLTSLACGIAPNATVLVMARAAQGAAAALLVPQVLSIIQATTSGERRARILGYYGATAGLAMVVGQLLGGVLVSAGGWRAVFLVNVPIGLAGVLLARHTVPETRAANPLGVDRWGTALLGLTLLTLLVPLMEGRALGWPAWCWVLLGLCPFAAAVFLAVERRMEAAGGVPLLPMSILRVASMRRGLGIAVPFFIGFGGFMFVYALTLQNGLRLGPLASGLALSPLAVAFLVMSLYSSRIANRLGRRAVVLGASVQLLGLLVLIGTVAIAWPDLTVLHFVPGTLLCGAGQGLTAPTMFRVILSRVPGELAGAGSGVLTTTQQTSLALGVAILGTVFATLGGTPAALITCTAIQAALVAAIAVAANRLPDPRG
ncbi:MFS transporter [Amycolatopsis sp. K13G38]|uniref:MFS transporter n=1 Tax=Amycolatopsis acididurans TaxID=2724524 RepID=A0ABX1J500_9PSEU|nr:MFS transporter [Amycolatopsis acididurans]NKQ53390.1 MFS transporter [Amycolatopsis acididurans]